MSSLLLTCRDKANLQKRYIPALRAAGWEGELVLVAPGDEVPGLETCAGLLLAGGGDIDPGYWEPAEPLHPAARVDAERDALEIPLARAAWERGLPILGICRGEQILNVALGGSLVQDIPDRYGCERSSHDGPDDDRTAIHHHVTLATGTRLAALAQTQELGVNSYHHQAAGRVAPGLVAAAWAGEVLEAVESEDPARFVIGVQWHPEGLVELENPAGAAARRIFEAFVAAAQTL